MVTLYSGSKLFNVFLIICSTLTISLLGIFCSKSFKYLKIKIKYGYNVKKKSMPRTFLYRRFNILADIFYKLIKKLIKLPKESKNNCLRFGV